MTKQEQIEKLTKEIRQVQTENLSQATSVHACAPQIAEALLENEMIVVLPCRVGDKFYRLRRSNFNGTWYVAEYDVDQIVVDWNGVCVWDNYEQLPWKTDEVYFSEKEAQKALEAMNEQRNSI